MLGSLAYLRFALHGIDDGYKMDPSDEIAFIIFAALAVPCVTQYVVLPGRKSGFRAGCRPDSNRESLKIGPAAGRRADFETFPIS